MSLYHGIRFKMEAMRIGELARRAEVNIQTIRFYERRRILRAPQRTSGGYRSYEKRDLEHLLFIKWCQRLGFTLKEVKELLPLHSALGGRPVTRKQQELQEIVAMAESKLQNIEGKITALGKMAKQVQSALRELKKTPAPICPAAKSHRPLAAKAKNATARCPRN